MVLVSRPYPTPPPLTPPQGGRWGGLDAPNPVLLMSMGREQPGRQVESALREVDSLAEFLPMGESLYRHSPSVGLR